MAVKTIINQILERGITKPNQIISALRKENQPEPSKSQLRNYLQYQKATKSPRVISIGQLAEVCELHSEPTSLDEPYVVAKEFVADDGTGNKLAFRFFMSTPRLLQLAEKAEAIHADATYKLLWEGKITFAGS